MIEYEIFYLGHNMTLISSEKSILSNLEFIKFADFFFLTVIYLPIKSFLRQFQVLLLTTLFNFKCKKNVQKFDKVLLDDFFIIDFDIHLFHGQLSINLLKKRRKMFGYILKRKLC